MVKAVLTLEEQINRALNGKKQGWVVSQMVEMGCEINDVQFSRKKKGNALFTEKEKTAISKILNIDLHK